MGAPTADATTLHGNAAHILLLDDEPGDYIEAVAWHFTATNPARPDADLTVLLMTTDPDMPMQQGWWDGEQWCLCESGGFAPAGSVLAWSEVNGPELPGAEG